MKKTEISRFPQLEENGIIYSFLLPSKSALVPHGKKGRSVRPFFPAGDFPRKQRMQKRGSYFMDYDYLKSVIEDGITDAMSSEDVTEAITEISSTVADEYLADHPDPDYPDRYSIGYSLHLICDSNADIAKSLRIMSGRSDCKVDVEEFNRRYEEEKSYFREYAAIVRNAAGTDDTTYEQGVLHGLAKGLSLGKWTYDQLNSNVSDKDKYHVESKEI